MVDRLPVSDCLADLEAALSGHPIVLLTAPTGSGKTTVVPGALLDAPWLARRKIIMLEPRRLAARLACEWMAHARGEAVGLTVGYRTGQESRVSAATRIEIMTEGVLTRRLQHDPEQRDVGLVIFDEVHERHLTTDLGLALLQDVQAGLRPDLRILLMSATLSRESLARHFPHAPLIESFGRGHAVDIVYLDGPPRDALAPRVREGVRRVFGKTRGDVLVFLPGMREILQCERALTEEARLTGFVLCRLHGAMTLGEQDQVLAKIDARRVILATSVAQSSVTLPSVDGVVDAGYMRIARYEKASGFTRLVTLAATHDVAEQRAGRAGRLRPGYCLRLWTANDHKGRPRFAPPEIEQADLSALTLDLIAWGTPDGRALSWLTEPSASGLAEGRALLQRLNLIDARGALTQAGRLAVDAGFPPRLAAVIFWACAAHRPAACALTVLLSERDPVRLRDDCSLGARLHWLREHRHGVLGDRLAQCAKRARTSVWTGDPELAADALVALLLPGYQDRLAVRVESKEPVFKLVSGPRAQISPADPLSRASVLIALVVEETDDGTWIRLATPVPEPLWTRIVREFASERLVLDWDARTHAFTAHKERFLGEVRLYTLPVALPSIADLSEPLKDAVRRLGLATLPWSQEARDLRLRLRRLREWQPEEAWPDVDDAALLAGLDGWLDVAIDHLAPKADIAALDLAYGLRHGLLSPVLRVALDRLAPTALGLRSGRMRPLRYPETGPPVLAAPIQEFFGSSTGPRVAGGRVAVVVELLSPARRPLQVTSDLARFWETVYPELRRSLSARYPRHEWPLDPLHPLVRTPKAK